MIEIIPFPGRAVSKERTCPVCGHTIPPSPAMFGLFEDGEFAAMICDDCARLSPEDLAWRMEVHAEYLETAAENLVAWLRSAAGKEIRVSPVGDIARPWFPPVQPDD